MAQGEKDKRRLGFHRNVLLLGGVSLFTDVSSEMIYPLLPFFLTSVLGAGTVFLGLVEGFAEATASFLKLFSGWFSDRRRKRKALVTAGYALSTVARPLVAVAASGWHVLLVRFADRVGKGIRTSPRDALIADSAPSSEQGKAFGLQRGLDHAGAVLGPGLAFLLLTFVTPDYRTLFLLAYVPGIAAMLLLGFGVREKFGPAPSAPLARPRLSLRLFDPGFKKYLLIVGLFSLGNSSDAFLLLKARDAGIAVNLLPVVWMILHVTKSLSSVPGGSLADAWGRRRTIISGWLLYAGVYAGFGWAEKASTVWVLFAVYGVYYGLTEGGERAIVADLVPSHLRGTAYGLYNLAIGISTLPSSLLMGYLWEKLGSGFAFGTGAVLAVLAALLLGLSARGRSGDR